MYLRIVLISLLGLGIGISFSAPVGAEEAGSVAADSYADQPAAGDEEGYSEEVEADAVVADVNRNPGKRYVRVDIFPLSVDVGVPGFWRLQVKPGFNWIEGAWNQEVYIPGYWKPIRSRNVNSEWAPGHWGGQYWIPGHWRPAYRDGYAWVAGHWTRLGEWIEGYWQPTSLAPQDQVWEPGYWGSRGWVEGFWRPNYRSGYIWLTGAWNGSGHWVCGSWKRARANESWEPGYWDRRGSYHAGRIVQMTQKTGSEYSSGHYNHQGEWVRPHWESANRPQAYRNQAPQHSAQPVAISESQQIKNYQRERQAPPSEKRQIQNYQNDRQPSKRQVKTNTQGGAIQKLGSSSEDEQMKNYQRKR